MPEMVGITLDQRMGAGTAPRARRARSSNYNMSPLGRRKRTWMLSDFTDSNVKMTIWKPISIELLRVYG